MDKRHFLIVYRIRDSEAECLDNYIVEIADTDTDPEELARTYLAQFWGDIPDDDKHGTADDPRWDGEAEAYWDSDMVRLVEVYSVRQIAVEEYKTLRRLRVAYDITSETVGRRIKLKNS